MEVEFLAALDATLPTQPLYPNSTSPGLLAPIWDTNNNVGICNAHRRNELGEDPWREVVKVSLEGHYR